VEETCPTGYSNDGWFAVEVPLAASRIRISCGPTPIEFELDGFTTRDIDLGRIVIETWPGSAH